MPATLEQKEKAQERRKAFRLLAKRVAAMTDEERSSLAAKMVGIVTVEGHNLSFHNVVMIAVQCPTATIVGGFRQWLKAGRVVRKGEHGMAIWCPIQKKTAEISGPAGVLDETETSFIVGTVFDVSQTDDILDCTYKGVQARYPTSEID